MLKQLIFFLLACNEQQTFLFLKRCGHKQKEEKAFSSFFLKQLRKYFKQLKQKNNDSKDCKNNIFIIGKLFVEKILWKKQLF